MENEKLFPFNTCEKPNQSGIAQPYSVSINILSCLIVLFFLVQSKSIYSFVFLFFILLFQLFHAFSHCLHISNSIQTNMIHMIAYLVNLSNFILLYHYTHSFPATWFFIVLFVLVCMDFYFLFFEDTLYYVVSQFIIILFIYFYYYPLLPKFIQRSIFSISFFIIVISIIIFNEKINCKKMLEFFPHFPFHILVEITGLIIFYIIASNFYKL
jgi:hypothetical protein